MTIFKLPDLGEGLPEAEIVEWFVQEGDSVKLDQKLVAVETAKAIVDIPSPQAGVVSRLYGQQGDFVQTGDPLLEFEGDQGSVDAYEKQDGGSVVGQVPATDTLMTESPQAVGGGHRGRGNLGGGNLGMALGKATPAIRALAQRMNVDLAVVTPSGPNGTIKASDVERVAAIFKQVGDLQPLKGVRRAMAATMSKAHAEVVAVTVTDDADIEIWQHDQDVTLRLIRAIIKACDKEPSLNAWYDSHSVGRRLIKQVHLGIAVDTQDGLFVPVIKNVEALSAEQLRDKINQLKQALKLRQVPPEDLRGNTITLSNFGNMGGRYADPVVVPPTVAILGAGSLRDEVVAVAGEVVVHKRIPLSLSFDHRAVTGGEACRFLKAIIDDLVLPE